MRVSRASLLILLVVLVAPSRVSAEGLDLFGVRSASKEAHAALAELNATANRLPEQLQETIGTSIKALGAEVEQLADRTFDSRRWADDAVSRLRGRVWVS